MRAGEIINAVRRRFALVHGAAKIGQGVVELRRRLGDGRAQSFSLGCDALIVSIAEQFRERCNGKRNAKPGRRDKEKRADQHARIVNRHVGTNHAEPVSARIHHAIKKPARNTEPDQTDQHANGLRGEGDFRVAPLANAHGQRVGLRAQLISAVHHGAGGILQQGR